MLGPINAGVHPYDPPVPRASHRESIPARVSGIARGMERAQWLIHRGGLIPIISAAFNCELNALGRRTLLPPSHHDLGHSRENENFTGIVSLISRKVTSRGKINRGATPRSDMVTWGSAESRMLIIPEFDKIFTKLSSLFFRYQNFRCRKILV